MSRLDEVKMPRTITYIFIAAFVSVVGSFIGYQLWVGSNTMPSPIEGFAGPSRGSGVPDCLRTSSEGAALSAMLSSKGASAEEGADDLRELNVLLGKLACFKRDLMGAAGVVQGTYKQPFYTSHDMEPIAETTARCFAKTIPRRDLQLSLDKWADRGSLLVKRLCTALNLSDSELQKANGLFKQVVADITDVSMTVCMKGPVTIGGNPGPRMVQGYEPTTVSLLREYNGYY